MHGRCGPPATADSVCPALLILPGETRPTPTFRLASMSVVEECRDSRRRREPYGKCSPGHTTGRALLPRRTASLQAGTESAVRQPSDPNNTLLSTSSVTLSRGATSAFAEIRVAFLRRRRGLGNLSTLSRGFISRDSRTTKVARSLGRFPPNIRAMLNRERLPQTRHVSWGRSLTTSHSAHRTAFCSATALRRRPAGELPSTWEPFTTEPHPRT